MRRGTWEHTERASRKPLASPPYSFLVCCPPPAPAPTSRCRPRSVRLALEARNPGSLQANRHQDAGRCIRVSLQRNGGGAARNVDLRQEGAWAGAVSFPRTRSCSGPHALRRLRPRSLAALARPIFSLLVHSFAAGPVVVDVVFVHSSPGAAGGGGVGVQNVVFVGI